MSDTNRTAIRYARENTFRTPVYNNTGTLTGIPADPTQASAFSLFNLRFTKEALDAEKESIKSEEIRSDRQVSSIIRVGQKVSGSLDAEMLMGDFDDLIAAAMQADYSTTVTTSVNVSGQTLTAAAGTPFAALVNKNIKHIKIANAATAVNNGIKAVKSITSSVITLAAGSLSGTDSADTMDISVNGTVAQDSVTIDGDTGGVASATVGGLTQITLTVTTGTYSTATRAARFVKLTGCNDGIYKVISCSSTVLVVQKFDNSTASVPIGTVTMKVDTNYVRTGATYVSHVMQKEFLDIPHYVVLTGMGVDTCEMKFDAKKQGTINFGFMGYKGDSRSADLASTGDKIAASNNVAVNSASNIGSLTKDGSLMANPVKTITAKISNNLRERPIIGDLGTTSHGSGEAQITGQIDVYFADKELLNAYLNHTAFALEFPIVDASGNVMNIYCPSVQASKGSPMAGGVNQDVMQTMPFDAFQDATKGYTCQIDRLAA